MPNGLGGLCFNFIIAFIDMQVWYYIIFKDHFAPWTSNCAYEYFAFKM